MSKLKKVLKKKKYIRIKLKRMKTNHLELKAYVNGVKGRFILDTGASNTCIARELESHFFVDSRPSEVKAAGAGATDMEARTSESNCFRIGKWKTKNSKLVLFDLQHVNTALEYHGESRVDGIIGADILESGRAIIDYTSKYLYLRKPKKKYLKKVELPF